MDGKLVGIGNLVAMAAIIAKKMMIVMRKLKYYLKAKVILLIAFKNLKDMV